MTGTKKKQQFRRIGIDPPFNLWKTDSIRLDMDAIMNMREIHHLLLFTCIIRWPAKCHAAKPSLQLYVKEAGF